ncbi:isochorismatase family protein [Nocardioides sp. GXZ039]|uniref:isochorismatase family protein n=1 Tax=Nocardioides sp. GXZ039 TaxID=3136018 RepID=UPI0030F387F5
MSSQPSATPGAAPSGTPEMGEDYAATGFGARVGYGSRPCLLVVDMVRAYVTEGEPFWAPAYADVTRANQELLTVARASDVPVIWTTLALDETEWDTGWFLAKVPSLRVYIERPELGGFDERLSPVPGELVVRKQFASAFFGTSLVSALTRLSVDTVLVTGVSTSGCVRATAVDALQHGFRPIVVAEAVGDRSDSAHTQSLFDLEAKYADVEPVERVVRYLREGAAS